jgi:hypothetical protein
MSLQIRKAQKEMEESSNYKQFFTVMKDVVPTVEVIVDSASIHKLEGTGRYNGNDEATPLVLFNVLRGYFWKGISKFLAASCSRCKWLRGIVKRISTTAGFEPARVKPSG